MLLQIAPTPSGVMPPSFTNLPPGQYSLSYIVSLIQKQYGSAIAAKFLQWWAGAKKKDPSLTPLEGATVFLTGYAISTNLGTAVSAEAKIPGAAAQGASKAYKDLLGGFNIGNWFLRIGEILIGLVLVGVGLARVTGAQNVISQLVKTKVPI